MSDQDDRFKSEVFPGWGLDDGPCPLCGCETESVEERGVRVAMRCPECAIPGGALLPAVIGRRIARGLPVPRDIH